MDNIWLKGKTADSVDTLDVVIIEQFLATLATNNQGRRQGFGWGGCSM